jgi:hypothetical protein
VSVKLTPEICINNASSNSRLIAAGRQATATDTIHRTVSRVFFFFLSLPTFDEKTTNLHLHAEKLTETVLHLNLGHFVGFIFFVQFCSILCVPFDETYNYRTTSEAPSPGLETETDTKIIKTETSLHLILGGFFFNLFIFYFLFVLFYLYIYFFHLLFIIFILIFFLSLFIFNPLSNACTAYCQLVH